MNVFVGAFGEAVLGLRDGGFNIGRCLDVDVALGGAACPVDCSWIVAVMLDTASHRDHDDDGLR